MAIRGDVFRLRRRVGFAESTDDCVVVLQATRLNTALPTLLVAPIDRISPLYARNPLAIPVSPEESGLTHDGVLVLPALASVPRARLEPSRAGSLKATTLAVADVALSALLGLR